MMIEKIIYNHLKFVLVMVFFLFLGSSAWAVAINTPLSIGSVGPEVKTLQILLNSDLQTRVASSGAGSPGQETDYFGPKTRLALIKFQQKYGINNEIGRAGSKTRVILEAVRISQGAKNVKSEAVMPSAGKMAASSGALSVKKRPIISSISPTKGGNNVLITIKGQNFLPQGNNIETNFAERVSNIASGDGQTLSFNLSLPRYLLFDTSGNEIIFSKPLRIPIGIWVENSNGRSNIVKYVFQK